MFNFLKETLKKAVAKFSKDVDEKADEVIEEQTEEEFAKQKAVKKPVKKEEKTKKEDKPKKKEGAKKEKHSPKKEEELQATEEPEEENGLKEEALELPDTEISVELNGIKESLQSYPDKDIDSLLDILGISSFSKDKSKNDKIKIILKRPLSEINSAIDRLDSFQESPLPEVEEEEPVEEKEEEKKEEEILEEVAKEEEVLETPEITPQEEKKGFFKRLFGFGKKKEETSQETAEKKPEEPKEEDLEEIEDEKEEAEKEVEKDDKELETAPETVEEAEKEERKGEKEDTSEEPEEEEEPSGFFGKIKQSFVMKKLSDERFEELFFDLEVALLENNVAVEVIEKIKKDLHERMVDKKIKRSDIDMVVAKSLKESLTQILSVEQIDILKRIKEKRKENKPYVITFVGINGSGKTTTIAKMAKYFMNNNLKPVLVAGDTFRAAAIQQLEEHANKLGIKIIKHDYGSDPAAVAFDGIKYAEAKGIDVVLIDTAGRLHSNTNLMDEMKKIMRIANPDLKIFVGESITGNDCIEQAQQFNQAVELDGIVLSKADVDEKGGAAISVSYVTGKPILFIGTGQTYDSLQKFDKKLVLENLGLA